MPLWKYIRSFAREVVVASAVAITSGCTSLPPPEAPRESAVEVGPTLDSGYVIRVCVKQPGVPRDKDFWGVDGSGRLVLEDSELAYFQQNGQSIYYFDPAADPASPRLLRIPYNTLKCVEQAPSVLSSTGKVAPKKPEPITQQASASPPPAPTTAQAKVPPPCTNTTEPGQKRSRGTTTHSCVRSRTQKAPSRPAPAQVAKAEVESSVLAQAVQQTPPSPSVVDWNVAVLAGPIYSGLDPQRVIECVGSLCHARHQNFAKQGAKSASKGVLEQRSLSTSGGGGAKAPSVRKPPAGPKSAPKGTPTQPGTPVKPKASEAPKVKEPNKNRVDDRPATLYERVDNDDNLRKHGVTHHEDPIKRYTRKNLGTDKVIPKERGPRKEMIKKERELVETNPGPDNREPWAGKRKPTQAGGKHE